MEEIKTIDCRCKKCGALMRYEVFTVTETVNFDGVCFKCGHKYKVKSESEDK